MKGRLLAVKFSRELKSLQAAKWKFRGWKPLNSLENSGAKYLLLARDNVVSDDFRPYKLMT